MDTCQKVSSTPQLDFIILNATQQTMDNQSTTVGMAFCQPVTVEVGWWQAKVRCGSEW